MLDTDSISKVVYITDLHAGGRNDAKWLVKAQEEFYTKQLFPYMIANNIKNIWCLGDLFDRRKFISFEILHAWKRFFFDPLRALGFHMEIIPGNHDIRFVNTLDVCSLELLLREGYSDCITIYDKPTEVSYNGGAYKVAWIPWVTPDAVQTTLDFFANTSAKHVNGHFDIMGVEMQRNQFSTHGFDADTFKKFAKVRTGHYHKRSTQGNITYVGSPTEYTWADYADPKGFMVFDIAADREEFVDNTSTIFAQYHYNPLDTQDKIRAHLNGKIAKVFVSEESRKDKRKYEKFLDFVGSLDTIDFNVIELTKDIVLLNDDGTENESAKASLDTKEIIADYIKEADIPDHLDRDRLRELVQSLYVETVHRLEHGEGATEFDAKT